MTPEDILQQLTATNRRGLSVPQLQQIVQTTLLAYDIDGDGRLSYPEVRAALCCPAEEGFLRSGEDAGSCRQHCRGINALQLGT